MGRYDRLTRVSFRYKSEDWFGYGLLLSIKVPLGFPGVGKPWEQRWRMIEAVDDVGSDRFVVYGRAKDFGDMRFRWRKNNVAEPVYIFRILPEAVECIVHPVGIKGSVAVFDDGVAVRIGHFGCVVSALAYDGIVQYNGIAQAQGT